MPRTDQRLEVATAVVDASGALMALGRMDDEPAPIVGIATDKTDIAGALGQSTQTFFNLMDSMPRQTAGAMRRPRLCAWPGGLAIYEGGALLGGCGVSCTHWD